MHELYLYLLFALTTGFTSYYELFSPVWGEIKKTNSIGALTTLVSGFIFISAATILAPIMILPCLVPGLGEAFRTSFKQAIENKG